jgi:hypothetical protein
MKQIVGATPVTPAGDRSGTDTGHARRDPQHIHASERRRYP